MVTTLLVLASLATATTQRVVVTFRNASLNTDSVAPENTAVVKQYGRRLVLRVDRVPDGEDSTLEQNSTEVTDWIKEALGGEELVERVEQDALASAFEFDDQSISNSSMSVAAIVVTNQSMDMPAYLTSGWNLDEYEPYGLHIRSLRMTTDGYGTTISIIDSGIADAAKPLFHPASGYDFISSPDYSNKPNQARNPDYTDPGDQGPTCLTPSWHGTKVASIAAAIAPGATLTIMRVLGQCGIGFSSDIADAIVWAAGGQINGLSANKFPASIISLSLAGRSECPTYLQSAVNQARLLGATVVAAAGNSAQDVSLYFPANCLGVISIGSSTRQGKPAAYSNWGRTLFFSAQGGDGANPVPVLTISNGQLARTVASGTSFAAPHVAGFMALISSVGVRLDSVAIIPFSHCDASGANACNGIISSDIKNPNQQRMAVLMPQSTFLNPERVSVNSSIAFASGDCGPGRHRVCSTTCFGGWGSCKWSWCEECEDCPSGYYCPDDNEKYSCDARKATVCFGSQRRLVGCGGAKKGDCFIDLCPANQFLSSTNYICSTCGHCAAGDYANGCGDYASGTCTACPASSCGDLQYLAGCSLSSSGSCAHCAECGAGTRFGGCTGGGLSDTRSCTNCDKGKYGGGGRSRSCTDCVAGKYNPIEGSANADSCRSCVQGKFNSNIASLSEGACTSCDTGKYNPNSGSNSDSACLNCPTGTSGPTAGAGGCEQCSAGKYNDQEGKSVCISCSAGSYNNLVGKKTADDCVKCPSGKYSAASAATDSSTCVGCDIGKYTASAGRSICDRCEAGKYGPNTGLSECINCATGTYSAALGRTSECESCATGTYNANTGGSSPSVCLSCNAGKNGPNTGMSVCSPCVPGTYQVSDGMTFCKTCDPGSYTTASNSVACQPCVPLTDCVVGWESTCVPDFGSKCLQCTPIYACTYHRSACFVSASTKVPDCHCSPGFELLDNICKGCPSGKFKSISGQGLCLSITTTLVCAPGTYMQLGTAFANSACIACPPLPDNALQGVQGCEWSCAAGFENNAP